MRRRRRLWFRPTTPRWGFGDCWGLDDEALAMVPTPCIACIFLYPYSQMEARKRALGVKRGAASQAVWFMKQQISNACGSVAIMHSVSEPCAWRRPAGLPLPHSPRLLPR